MNNGRIIFAAAGILKIQRIPAVGAIACEKAVDDAAGCGGCSVKVYTTAATATGKGYVADELRIAQTQRGVSPAESCANGGRCSAARRLRFLPM